MKRYVKPTIGDMELRPEEGLATFGSEGCWNGGNTNLPDLGGIINNIDWNRIFDMISGWLSKLWRH